MISKTELKYYSSLLQKKYRKEEGKFIIDGKRIVEEGLKSSYECEIIFVSNTFAQDYIEFINNLQKSHKIEIVHNKEFEKLSDTQNPQGIAAVFKMPEEKELNFTSKLITALEDIADPGNLGTIIRNCDWFGIKELLIGENCVELFNPKVLRASMGSVFHIKIQRTTDIIKRLTSLKNDGYRLLCSDIKGESVFTFNPTGKSVIIFCSEAFGPSPELLHIIDDKITIPKIGNAESLNVACASAVMLAELTR